MPRRPSHFIALLSVAAACAATGVLAGPAAASEMLDRNATGVSLAVNRDKQALVTYRARGRVRHVLVWGAVDGRTPNPSIKQVEFKIDYSGGWGTYRRLVWKNFRNACQPYDGPRLAFLVTACKAPDGSYWALQSWQRMLPALGFTPWLRKHSAWELRISHWSPSVAPARIEVWPNWVYGNRFHALFGRVTYKGKPVYGFKSTRFGSPLEAYSRNLYLDTYNSRYGAGWRRENGFLAHRPRGVFCYGFFGFAPNPSVGYEHPPGWPATRKRPRGHGERYRLSMIGPGVSPDVVHELSGLPDFNRGNPQHLAIEQQVNALIRQIAPRCHS